MLRKTDGSATNIADLVKILISLSHITALARNIPSLFPKPKDGMVPLDKGDQNLLYEQPATSVPAANSVVGDAPPEPIAIELLRPPIQSQPPTQLQSPTPPTIAFKLTQLSNVLLVSVPSALALGAAYFWMHPSSPSPPKPDGVRSVGVAPVDIFTWGSNTEDSGDVIRRNLVGPSVTSYLNPDKMSLTLEKPKFSSTTIMPVLINLPENNPGRFVPRQYQGLTDFWISNFSERGAIYGFDTVSTPVEEIQKTEEVAREISGIRDTPRGANVYKISSGRSSGSSKSNTGVIFNTEGSVKELIPTPALLPGILGFGLGWARKQRQKLVVWLTYPSLD